MKALSLWQPWATLVAIEAKGLETRSWSTNYRGRLAIHAAKKWTHELSDLCDQPPFLGALDAALPQLETDAVAMSPKAARLLPLGCIVATADLTDCIAITLRNAPDEPEYSFGDYRPGRFMWRLENVRRLPTPIPCRGAQGLFNVPADVLGLILDGAAA